MIVIDKERSESLWTQRKEGPSGGRAPDDTRDDNKSSASRLAASGLVCVSDTAQRLSRLKLTLIGPDVFLSGSPSSLGKHAKSQESRCAVLAQRTQGGRAGPWWPTSVEADLILRGAAQFSSHQGENDKQFTLPIRQKYLITKRNIQMFI